MIDNDYLCGRETTDFEHPYISKFTEKLRNIFEQYTGQK